MASSTVTQTITAVSSSVSSTATSRVAPQGGVLEGSNPSQYDASNPIILFIIQAGIIIIFCRMLHYPLSKLRQPRVIAEVIGGIILGPSVMMRIPGFQAAIFPTSSMPILNLVANLGLILFLFLVALEVDMRLFLSNWRVALSVGLAGMILPFGLGCGIAWGLYNAFRTDSGLQPVSFGIYMLFIGTALSITAFPVLCRILTELKILSTPVGVTVLAAGVGNDVTGWVLLALCVALVNNASGLTALWVLLCCVGWILFLVFAVRPCFLWILRRTGSIQNGPTQGMVALTLLLTLTSAWFTGIIGVHPIFGAFLVGLICPHDGGFAIKLTEKIEDLVTVLFLPLYFALSGLSTNLGLLNDGITWAYVVGVIAVAFAGKIIGGTLAARSCRLVWRESLTIGVLMSCKGLVELIVLNIGLQAKILSTRTFTIFVVMALVTTVATTPLVSALYPPWYQKKLEAWKRGEIDWDGNRLIPEHDAGQEPVEKLRSTAIRRLLVYLRLDSLPSLFTFVSLLRDEAEMPHGSLVVHGVRMLELTERTSSVMKSSEAEDYRVRDPVLNAFSTFAQLNHVAVSGDVSVLPESSYAETIVSKASDMSSDLILIPWSETGALSEGDQSSFLPDSHAQDQFSGGPQMTFLQTVLNTATCNTVVFINRGFVNVPHQDSRSLQRTISGLSIRPALTVPSITDLKRHVFFPFFGGSDDRVALRLVLQLARSIDITASVVHIKSPAVADASKASGVTGNTNSSPTSEVESSQEATMPPVDRETLSSTTDQDQAFFHSIRDSLPSSMFDRVSFTESWATSNISSWFARKEVPQSLKLGDLIVIGRRRGARHLVTEPLAKMSNGAELRRTLGATAECMIFAGVNASILVVQAGGLEASGSPS